MKKRQKKLAPDDAIERIAKMKAWWAGPLRNLEPLDCVAGAIVVHALEGNLATVAENVIASAAEFSEAVPRVLFDVGLPLDPTWLAGAVRAWISAIDIVIAEADAGRPLTARGQCMDAFALLAVLHKFDAPATWEEARALYHATEKQDRDEAKVDLQRGAGWLSRWTRDRHDKLDVAGQLFALPKHNVGRALARDDAGVVHLDLAVLAEFLRTKANRPLPLGLDVVTAEGSAVVDGVADPAALDPARIARAREALAVVEDVRDALCRTHRGRVWRSVKAGWDDHFHRGVPWAEIARQYNVDAGDLSRAVDTIRRDAENDFRMKDVI